MSHHRQVDSHPAGFQIGSRSIGTTERCFIIGEVGQNHDGSLGTAHSFIDSLGAIGVDAIKFQTHIADAESTPFEPWRVKFSKQDASRFEYWKRMEFTEPQWLELKDHCEEKGIEFLSSPFSIEAVELLERLDVKAWKVASGEVNNVSLMQRLSETGIPILISSGMSRMSEVETAVSICRKKGVPFSVFQCTTAYPCPAEKIGLNMLAEFSNNFNCPVGLSDHSGEIFPGLAAVALGCQLLEVHVTYHKEMFGPDVPASLDLDQMKVLVNGVRFTERMVSCAVDKEAFADEAEPLRGLFTKSLVATRDLKSGKFLVGEDICLRKPGTGIPGNAIDDYLGKPLSRNVEKGQLLKVDDFLNDRESSASE